MELWVSLHWGAGHALSFRSELFLSDTLFLLSSPPTESLASAQGITLQVLLKPSHPGKMGWSPGRQGQGRRVADRAWNNGWGLALASGTQSFCSSPSYQMSWHTSPSIPRSQAFSSAKRGARRDQGLRHPVAPCCDLAEGMAPGRRVSIVPFPPLVALGSRGFW